MAMAMAMAGRAHTSSQLSQPLSEIVSQNCSMLTSITSVLRALNPHRPTFPHPDHCPLNRFSPYLTSNLVIEVIKNQSNPYHALFFFKWSSYPNPNPNNYSHPHCCYVAVTDLLLSHGLSATAAALLHSSNRLSDFMVGKFIKAHGDRGDIRGAIYWFHRAKAGESGRCLFSYNAILGVLMRANRMNLARAFFDQIVKEGVVKPDVSTYTTMIRGFCKIGMVEDAKKVFDEMKCEPNLVTYNTIVNGLCKKGLMDSALGIVDRMRESGDCLPDTVTFTTLIDGYCKRGELDEAQKCFDEMVSQNCEPSLLTYNAMIHGLCLNGYIDEAKRMMTRMRLNGLRDNVATHTSLLKGYCVAGRSVEAVRHLKEMASLGMKPDVKSYGVLVNEYCKIGKADDAITLLVEMRSKGINPNVSSFNAVFRVLMDSGELEKAIRLLKQMPKMGCHPNFLSYNTVICSLCRAKGRMLEAEGLVNSMIRGGHNLDATLYSCLVEGYSKDGNEGMAVQFFHEMMDKGYVINLESFAAFAKLLGTKGELFGLQKFFEISRFIDLDSYRKIVEKYVTI